VYWIPVRAAGQLWLDVIWWIRVDEARTGSSQERRAGLPMDPAAHSYGLLTAVVSACGEIVVWRGFNGSGRC